MEGVTRQTCEILLTLSHEVVILGPFQTTIVCSRLVRSLVVSPVLDVLMGCCLSAFVQLIIFGFSLTAFVVEHLHLLSAPGREMLVSRLHLRDGHGWLLEHLVVDEVGRVLIVRF